MTVALGKLIERVARAIQWEAGQTDHKGKRDEKYMPLGWDQLTKRQRARYLAVARAAIKAMEEPSE